MAPHIYESAFDNARGLWTQTATIDWCETNYTLSYYIAEFWNTLSNLAFIIPQLIAYITLSKDKCFEQPFLTAYLSTIIVGIGSLCFHMTLSRPMQMLDETSMIVVSLQGFYLLYIIRCPSVNKRLLAASVICYGLVFLILYVFLVEMPIFHHTAFGILVYVSMFQAYQLKKQHGQHYKFWTVFIMQHIAFGFWLVDKHHCEVLTHFRENHVPLVLRPLFQFHALWHLLMGLSTHLFICAIIKLRAWLKHKEIYVIKYKCLGLLATLEKKNFQDAKSIMDEKSNVNVKPMSRHRDVKNTDFSKSSLQSLYTINQDRKTDINRNDITSYCL